MGNHLEMFSIKFSPHHSSTDVQLHVWHYSVKGAKGLWTWLAGCTEHSKPQQLHDLIQQASNFLESYIAFLSILKGVRDKDKER